MHDVTLRILRRPKRGDGAVCVLDPTGRRLKIPVWMLLPEAAEMKIEERAQLGRAALLSLTTLIPNVAEKEASSCPLTIASMGMPHHSP